MAVMEEELKEVRDLKLQASGSAAETAQPSQPVQPPQLWLQPPTGGSSAAIIIAGASIAVAVFLGFTQLSMEAAKTHVSTAAAAAAVIRMGDSASETAPAIVRVCAAAADVTPVIGGAADLFSKTFVALTGIVGLGTASMVTMALRRF